MIEKHSDDCAVPLRLCGFCQSWNSKPCGEQCRWLPTDPTLEQMRAKDVDAKSQAREDIFRSALLDIRNAHVPDQPAHSQADETTWVMQHVGFIRGIASKAIDATLTPAGADEGKGSEGGPLNWQLSDDAKARLAEIDANLRNAAINASNIVAGNPSSPTAERREIMARALRSLKEITPKGFANYHNLIDEALSGLAALDGGAGRYTQSEEK